MGRRCETTLALHSGGRGRKFESSHPDQFFFIKLISCYLFGRYHELTLYLLPDFRLTSTNGNLPSPKTTHPRNPCLPECSAHEHCLGSADSAYFQRSADKSLKVLKRPLSEYGSARLLHNRVRSNAANAVDKIMNFSVTQSVMALPVVTLEFESHPSHKF